MGRWQYLTYRTKLVTQNWGEEIQSILSEHGDRGWELVQILDPREGDACDLIFKSEKPLIPPRE